jgi:hypothetical protein
MDHPRTAARATGSTVAATQCQQYPTTQRSDLTCRPPRWRPCMCVVCGSTMCRVWSMALVRRQTNTLRGRVTEHVEAEQQGRATLLGGCPPMGRNQPTQRCDVTCTITRFKEQALHGCSPLAPSHVAQSACWEGIRLKQHHTYMKVCNLCLPRGLHCVPCAVHTPAQPCTA